MMIWLTGRPRTVQTLAPLNVLVGISGMSGGFVEGSDDGSAVAILVERFF